MRVPRLAATACWRRGDLQRWRGMLGVIIALTVGGFIGSESGAGQHTSPVLIGALTEAWGPTPVIIGLRNGLVELGYRENEHFVIGIRFTQGDPDPTKLESAARELVRHGAHLIVTGGGPNAPKAAQMATRHIPIVFMGGSDPVGAGLVKSFARPGGNITGIADLDVDLAPKRLEIFRELVPDLKRVLFPYDPGEPNAAAHLAGHREAARHLGVTLIERPVRTQDEARDALARVHRGEVDGIFSPRSVSLNIPAFILEMTAIRAIPAMFHDSIWVDQGGLASYSANPHHVGRHAARLVDRIIKGARPADIPVERATRFDLVINVKTAKALGLAIPPSLLLRVDRVVE